MIPYHGPLRGRDVYPDLKPEDMKKHLTQIGWKAIGFGLVEPGDYYWSRVFGVSGPYMGERPSTTPLLILRRKHDTE